MHPGTQVVLTAVDPPTCKHNTDAQQLWYRKKKIPYNRLRERELTIFLKLLKWGIHVKVHLDQPRIVVGVYYMCARRHTVQQCKKKKPGPNKEFFFWD